MGIVNKFIEASKRRSAISAIEKKLSMLFALQAKPLPKEKQVAHKSQNDGMGGEIMLDALVSPVFSAIFGAGLWDAINMAQAALETFGDEMARSQCSFAVIARNSAEISRAKAQLGYYSPYHVCA